MVVNTAANTVKEISAIDRCKLPAVFNSKRSVVGGAGSSNFQTPIETGIDKLSNSLDNNLANTLNAQPDTSDNMFNKFLNTQIGNLGIQSLNQTEDLALNAGGSGIVASEAPGRQKSPVRGASPASDGGASQTKIVQGVPLGIHSIDISNSAPVTLVWIDAPGGKSMRCGSARRETVGGGVPGSSGPGPPGGKREGWKSPPPGPGSNEPPRVRVPWRSRTFWELGRGRRTMDRTARAQGHGVPIVPLLTGLVSLVRQTLAPNLIWTQRAAL